MLCALKEWRRSREGVNQVLYCTVGRKGTDHRAAFVIAFVDMFVDRIYTPWELTDKENRMQGLVTIHAG